MNFINIRALVSGITLVAITALSPITPARADQIREAQWFARYLNLAKAHQITTGSGVSVAVVDSGVFPHKDLIKNLKKGTDTGPDGDGTGKVDNEGHGTGMAGLIAGHGSGTNDGVIGIAPDAQVIPVKIFGKEDNRLGAPAGIKWAAAAGADVINFSGAATRSRDLTEAISEAVRADTVVIAAAGNRSADPRIAQPAALPEVLAVGATDQNGKIAKFSVTGPKVGICAPGVDMATTDINNKYSKGSGTSQATAVVSGAAALVRAKFPELSAPEVIHRLTATADDNGPPGKDNQCGAGVLNIVKALTADVPPLTVTGSPGSGSAQPTVSSVAPTGSVAASVAAAEPKSSGSSLPAIAGAGVAVVVLGGLIALLVAKRRRSSS